MLADATARELAPVLAAHAEEAAQRLLVTAALLERDLAPPKERSALTAWQERREALLADFDDAAYQLELALSIRAKLAP